jgi:hypothetical protein
LPQDISSILKKLHEGQITIREKTRGWRNWG